MSEANQDFQPGLYKLSREDIIVASREAYLDKPPNFSDWACEPGWDSESLTNQDFRYEFIKPNEETEGDDE